MNLIYSVTRSRTTKYLNYYIHNYIDASDTQNLGWGQPVVIQELLNDLVSCRRIIMHIERMPSVRLDICLECTCSRESFLRSRRYGGQGGVAGRHAVAAAKDEVLICRRVSCEYTMM